MHAGRKDEYEKMGASRQARITANSGSILCLQFMY